MTVMLCGNLSGCIFTVRSIYEFLFGFGPVCAFYRSVLRSKPPSYSGVFFLAVYITRIGISC